jgi:hypothetical protein
MNGKATKEELDTAYDAAQEAAWEIEQDMWARDAAHAAFSATYAATVETGWKSVKEAGRRALLAAGGAAGRVAVKGVDQDDIGETAWNAIWEKGMRDGVAAERVWQAERMQHYIGASESPEIEVRWTG